MKLDDDSVSNDNIYTYEERKNYSPMEYERYLLNKNFRINLVNLDPDWSNISYGDDGQDDKQRRRTVDKVYQGPRISKTLLEYFASVVDNGSVSDDIYVPFTNANDFSVEVSLVPNTHPDFRQITSRAYYDAKWAQYKRLLAKFNISAISTFALVDPKKDKNHTGGYLVKIQYKVSDNAYKYLVTTIDKDGHVVSDPIVSQEPTTDNTILCVCEGDFALERAVPTSGQRETWNPVEGDIPMVHSTTSSHYPIFRQRIPDYDLKLVRHYLQFKNRLAGMELCLEQVKRDVHHKEVHSAECFSKLTMVLKRLMDEFASNKELMEWVTKWYDLYAEWDKLNTKRYQLIDVRDGKLDLLKQLQDEYRALDDDEHPIGHRLDEKLALGQKIASLRLELDKSIQKSLESMEERIREIEQELQFVAGKIDEIQRRNPGDWKIPEDDANRILAETTDDKLDKVKNDMLAAISDMRKHIGDGDSEDERGSVEVKPSKPRGVSHIKRRDQGSEDGKPKLGELDTRRLHRLVVQSERWRNYSFNIGFELGQYKKMLTMCEDATIKVKRLLHNFEERMKDTQEQVWDENYNLRPDFDFKDISVAGLRDIILLHDWWAANAPGAKPEDLHMTPEQFMQFRRRCNKVSYNLRKNQYAQLLAVQIDRAERRIEELEDTIESRDTLHWDDKYGEDAERDDGEPKWTVEQANAKARERIRLLAQAQAIIDDSGESERGNASASPTRRQIARRRLVEEVVKSDANFRECAKLEKQYKEDSKKLVQRTIDYLKHLGIVETESDIERLAMVNATNKNQGIAQRWLEDIKAQRDKLDSSVDLMQSQRKALQSIIDSVAKMEEQIKELKERNKRIYDICMKSCRKKVKGVDKQVRNRMLLDKLNNEQRIFELKQLIKKAKSQHLEDFSSLETMRKEVDDNQGLYDKKVRQFKDDIGLTRETIDNLMVGIYNKFQDEILEHNNKR